MRHERDFGPIQKGRRKPRTSEILKLRRSRDIRMFQIHMRHNLMTTTNELAQVTVTAELFDAKVSEVLAILRTTNWHFDEEGDHQSFPQKAEILASLFGIHLQTTIHYYLTRQLRCEMSEDISEEDLYFLATMIAQLLNAGLFRQLPSARR